MHLRRISGIEKEIETVNNSIRADYSDKVYGTSNLSFGNAGPNPIIAQLRETNSVSKIYFNFDKAEKFSFNDYVNSRKGKKWLRDLETKKKEIDEGKKVNLTKLHITFDI